VLDDTVDPETVARDVGGCPVKCFTVFDDQPAGQYWAEGDALREETPAFFNQHAQGYWVVTRYDAVRDLYQSADVFSSESFTAWDPHPRRSSHSMRQRSCLLPRRRWRGSSTAA